MLEPSPAETQPRPAFARPVVTRSQIMLEVAEELVSSNGWPYQQASLIQLLAQGGPAGGLRLLGGDSPNNMPRVAQGEADFAIVNPACVLTLATRATGPYAQQGPLPLRTIAVVPSRDCFLFAVSERTGLTSLEDLREKRYPLRVSVRGQQDHGNHVVEQAVLGAVGLSFDDIVSWGGEVRYDPGLPQGISTSGADMDVSRVERVRRGEVDAIFDEAYKGWIDLAVDAGMRILSLPETLVAHLESLGFRRFVIQKVERPRLPSDVLTLDFSGWPIYTRADASDEIVTAFCDALEARKERVAWQGHGPFPTERACRDAPDTPLDVPLHPAAERVWRKHGYI